MILSPREVSGAETATLIAAHKSRHSRASLLIARVGACLHRRARYVGRYVYWTWMHGTTKHAAWVCNYEGLWW